MQNVRHLLDYTTVKQTKKACMSLIADSKIMNLKLQTDM